MAAGSTVRSQHMIRSMWQKLDRSLRLALGVFLVGRIVFSVWSLVILLASPVAVQNLTLLGHPVVSAFDLRNNRSFLYLRNVQGQMLRFFPNRGQGLVDLQTGSYWDLAQGQAVAGPLAGEALQSAPIDAERVFPYSGANKSSIPWLALWQRFDANWLLKIAEKGYAGDDGSTAFFPLYPFMTYMFGFLVGDVFLASLLVASLSLIIVLFLLHKIVIAYSDEDSADRSLFYLILFPTSFFFFAGYTESTFLMFVLGSFWFARKQKWVVSALLGALAALTRGIGLFLFIPLIYMWWMQGESRRWRDALTLCLVPFAAISYLAITSSSTFTSYQNNWHSKFSFPWEHFMVWRNLLAHRQLSIVDGFNLLITILFGCLSVVIWFKLPRELGLYSFLMLLAPLFGLNEGQPFVSMARYVLVIFPAFILLGQWGRNPWMNRLILYSSFPLALYFSAQFWMWGWVG